MELGYKEIVADCVLPLGLSVTNACCFFTDRMQSSLDALGIICCCALFTTAQWTRNVFSLGLIPYLQASSSTDAISSDIGCCLVASARCSKPFFGELTKIVIGACHYVLDHQ